MPRSRGRGGRPWRTACAAVRARVQAGEPCRLCGRPINLALPARTRWSFSVDHLVPLSAGGDPLNPANLAPAHLGCNAARGARTTPRTTPRPAHTAELPRWHHTPRRTPQW